MGKPWAFYNEIDPFAAAWLRELIKEGLIADGEVDERSIADVRPADLDGFVQCHFFAGIGGWSYALRLAGWSDDRAVWTGSCPCQPWSVAGQANGSSDHRDLWYAWFRLIRESRPGVVFGEQVEGPAARAWLDRVCADVEHLGYAIGAVALPAASVGAAHLRQRIWFVADAGREGRQGHQPIECVPLTAGAALTIDGDALADARAAMAGHISGLLPCDGLSVQMERDAVKGYGNAIVPPVAAAFIEAYLDTVKVCSPVGRG